jgi:hypothetical protein
MAPVDLRYEKGRFVVVHRCTACGAVRRCRARDTDNLNAWLG